jgi:CDP-glucose 4,6-dehydratase
LFHAATVSNTLEVDTRADLSDLHKLSREINSAAPQIVFHLAAQPLVRESYSSPLATLAANVTGTAHLLEAVRQCPSVEAVVVITTDKVYHNHEWPYPYRESDHLGGHDIYSASKAAAEIVTSAYRSSFFGQAGHRARIATARAGNVIGGGDWAPDRLVPDCLRAFAAGETVRLRNPSAIRPWQHVLEPLAGYIKLAECLMESNGDEFVGSWNFGPDSTENATVGEVARLVADFWGNNAQLEIDHTGCHPHEAGLLSLDSSAARAKLGWKPRWQLQKAVEHTVGWHQAWLSGAHVGDLCRQQIAYYQMNS